MPAEQGGTPRRCGVLGSPIGHSLSPVLHRAAYAELGLNWSYDAHEVAEAELATFIASMGDQWRGLSLTMPLKRAVLALCDRVEHPGALIGSVNTLLVEADGSRVGHNTDVDGFVRALTEAGVQRLKSVCIVGAGATAASALAAAARLGATSAVVLARSVQRSEPMQALGPLLGLDVRLHPLDGAGPVQPPDASHECDLLISTIPAGAQSAALGLSLAGLAPVVCDVVYAPSRTPLLEAGSSRGAVVIPGFELLVNQAARQVELMTGALVAPVEAMRRAGLGALDHR